MKPFRRHDAEIAVFKYIQANHFKGEIDALSKENPVPRSSSIYKLDPFIQDDLLRVGGRLSRAKLPAEMKHPILMPKRSHATDLLVRDAHASTGHSGRHRVLSELRAKYWIIHGNATVRRVINDCYHCRRYRKQANNPKMADLPEERCTPDAAPFTYSGTDVFGPFMVKVGRKTSKRYGLIFTCLASRAVHIEILYSLDTSSFIHALRRFQARRGPVTQLRCDNGTNFKGAERELQKAIAEMSDELRSKLLRHGIEWVYNPPHASHMGGVWERLIRSVRNVLSNLMQEHRSHALDDEALHTLMCEVESIINSRPLTTPSNDPNDLNPLTPNDILTLKSRVFLPPPGVFQRHDVYCRRRWRRVQYLADQFWVRWRREFLLELQRRTKWCRPCRNLEEGDIVVVHDDQMPRNCWPLAKVVKTFPSADGTIRSADVMTQKNVLKRPASKIVVVVPMEK